MLTNVLAETDDDRALYEKVKTMAAKRGSLFVPVQLRITKEEHLRRIVNPSRRDRWKSIDPHHVDDETPLLAIAHPHVLELDVTDISPENAAEKIMNHAKKYLP